MNVASEVLQPVTEVPWAQRLKGFPQVRYMGSKARLLPWIAETLTPLPFSSVLDAFSGSGAVSYLFKAMGKQVFSNDFLNFPTTLATALVENSDTTLSSEDVAHLLEPDPSAQDFITRTFQGIFYTPADLQFLDSVSARIRQLPTLHARAVAMGALLRSCAKRQPRGVFTVSDPERYKDGRRDLKLTLREHFLEQVPQFNSMVFDNGSDCHAFRGDVFSLPPAALAVDLVYLDPPYVPRSDDNCYVKRYHFLEGLSQYWDDLEILPKSKVRKIAKPYTPFSYRKDALGAFDNMFRQFAPSTIVLSYSSNGFPDLETLTALMGRYKRRIEVFTKQHTYHFGTHAQATRTKVDEYLIVGAD